MCSVVMAQIESHPPDALLCEFQEAGIALQAREARHAVQAIRMAGERLQQRGEIVPVPNRGCDEKGAMHPGAGHLPEQHVQGAALVRLWPVVRVRRESFGVEQVNVRVDGADHVASLSE